VWQPVCTTEIGRLALKYKDLESKGVKLATLSCDPVTSHQKWLEDVVAHCENKASRSVASVACPNSACVHVHLSRMLPPSLLSRPGCNAIPYTAVCRRSGQRRTAPDQSRVWAADHDRLPDHRRSDAGDRRQVRRSLLSPANLVQLPYGLSAFICLSSAPPLHALMTRSCHRG